MKSKAIALSLCLALMIGTVVAQKMKPWTEWTQKDAEKMLQESNWAQTQTETDTSEPTYSPANNSNVSGKGALNQSTKLDFYIYFLSAKPIRQAYLRLAELSPNKSTPDQIDKMRQFVEGKEYEKTIVVAVRCFSTDQRFFQSAFSSISNAITNTIKNNCYLDVKGGKRVFLQEYQAPIPGQNLGAKFIFPRFVDDKPVIDEKSGDVRFYAEFPAPTDIRNIQVKLDMRFKVAKFMYEGKLEF